MATTCYVCGRTLSDPDSVARGIGPICASKRGTDEGTQYNFHDDVLWDAPGLCEALVVERVEYAGPYGPLNKLATNVPHLVVQHSPTGYEWGYGGSGPADLALNVCEAILKAQDYQGNRMECFKGSCFQLAYMIHNDFKAMFVATIPREPGRYEIPASEFVPFIMHAVEEEEVNLFTV